MSKSTLINLVPFPIIEFKPGVYPGTFEIPASNNEMPQLLVISDSIYYVEIDENRTITVKCPSEDIARSIIDDYITANLAYSVEEDAAPGFFWKPGEHDYTSIITKFSKDLEYHKERQNRWFRKLVEMADDDWERSRQHKFISDMQRYAAKSLKLTRPWIISTATEQGLIKCPACAGNVPSTAIVCQFCRCVLNMDKYRTLQFAEK